MGDDGMTDEQKVEAFTKAELKALKAKALRLAVGARAYDGGLQRLTELARMASELEYHTKD